MNTWQIVLWQTTDSYILWYFLIVNEFIFLSLISVIFSTLRKYKRLPISFEFSFDTITKPE
jgi:hypothetical protein